MVVIPQLVAQRSPDLGFDSRGYRLGLGVIRGYINSADLRGLSRRDGVKHKCCNAEKYRLCQCDHKAPFNQSATTEEWTRHLVWSNSRHCTIHREIIEVRTALNQKALNSALNSLHRYYIWANRMRLHFDGKLPVVSEQLKKEPQRSTFEFIEANLYMSYWYGGLYVVIEGWQQLRLSDSTIDELLASPNVRLLKEYRNGVFHFQRAYFDKRFTNFMTEGENVVDWVRDLNRAFGEYFLNWWKRT